jgi:hypothetical protein
VSETRRFAFALAGHLKMTVSELMARMSSREFTEWKAYTRFFEAIPDSWAETGLVVSAVLAPHCAKGKAPPASDFNPIEKPPQHPAQARDVILDLKKALGVE